MLSRSDDLPVVQRSGQKALFHVSRKMIHNADQGKNLSA